MYKQSMPLQPISLVHEILNQSVKIDTLHYLQTISVPATAPSTVLIVLSHSVTSILWKQPHRFMNVIPQMGTYNTICTLLGTIGKRFLDAGKHDLCFESSVFGEGFTAGVMEGCKVL